MKLNKKGFMLAEVVISASVVAVILVTIYIGLNRMTSAYEKRNRYYDIDAMQFAMEFNDLDRASGGEQADQSDVENLERLAKLQGYSGIIIRTVQYSSDKLSRLSYSLSQSFKDYIDYLINKLDFNADYDYIVIVELQKKDENDCYYYALKVK